VVGGEKKMPMYFDIDEVLEDLERVMRKFRDSALEFKEIGEEENRDDSEMERTDDPDEKGYTVSGGLEPEPLEPIEPLVRRRRPLPGRFADQEDIPQMNEPLVDVFDRGNEVKVYVELPHAEKDDVQLNVTEGGVEVKTKGFYRLVEVPAGVDIGRASSRQKNRVLEVTIPKREKLPESETHRIIVE
jgi:HSP20 family molecular chaperone IbpA